MPVPTSGTGKPQKNLSRRVQLVVPRILVPLRKGKRKVGCRHSSIRSRKVKRRDHVINPVSILTYSKVKRAGNGLGRTGAVEDCTVTFPPTVFGHRLVADPGRRIITRQFEQVSDRHYEWRLLHRGSKGHYRHMRAATIARRIADGRPSFDDVQRNAGARSTARFASVHRQ